MLWQTGKGTDLTGRMDDLEALVDEDGGQTQLVGQGLAKDLGRACTNWKMRTVRCCRSTRLQICVSQRVKAESPARRLVDE